MEVFEIFILLIVIVWGIITYRRYSPNIDMVVSGRKYIVLLWYYKYYWDGDCRRTYIKLFEI